MVAQRDIGQYAMLSFNRISGQDEVSLQLASKVPPLESWCQ
jgi:hypothetical protein